MADDASVMRAAREVQWDHYLEVDVYESRWVGPFPRGIRVRSVVREETLDDTGISSRLE